MTWDPASGSATRGHTSDVVREKVAVFKLAVLRSGAGIRGCWCRSCCGPQPSAARSGTSNLHKPGRGGDAAITERNLGGIMMGCRF